METTLTFLRTCRHANITAQAWIPSHLESAWCHQDEIAWRARLEHDSDWQRWHAAASKYLEQKQLREWVKLNNTSNALAPTSRMLWGRIRKAAAGTSMTEGMRPKLSRTALQWIRRWARRWKVGRGRVRHGLRMDLRMARSKAGCASRGEPLSSRNRPRGRICGLENGPGIRARNRAH